MLKKLKHLKTYAVLSRFLKIGIALQVSASCLVSFITTSIRIGKVFNYIGWSSNWGSHRRYFKIHSFHDNKMVP